jgi:hypothetical protein
VREDVMGSFVLLYSGGEVPESEDEQARVMQAWTDWYAGLGSAVTDPGNPFSPQAKRIGPDGAIEDAPADASGYTIVGADSLADAADIAKGCPVLTSGGSVRVYETFQVM